MWPRIFYSCLLNNVNSLSTILESHIYIYICGAHPGAQQTSKPHIYIYIYVAHILAHKVRKSHIYIYIYAAHISAHNLGTMQFLELVPFSVI